jgi:hypothetical protein
MLKQGTNKQDRGEFNCVDAGVSEGERKGKEGGREGRDIRRGLYLF